MELDMIYNEDCLEGMKRIPDGSVDCIICDLPYGTTRNKWDSVIPFDKLWDAYKRVAKQDAAIVLFSQQPFTSELVMSNPDMFRYEWIWEKSNSSGFLNAKKMPLKVHENIMVFYSNLPTYNPQYTEGKPYVAARGGKTTTNYRDFNSCTTVSDGKRYPKDVIKVNSVFNTVHPTQKPVELVRYLVRTYTNEGDTVLDNCMGSGTTAVACIMENRHYIGFETNAEYFGICMERIRTETKKVEIAKSAKPLF